MPLVMCPSCGRISYMYPLYNEEGVIVSYRCSECYNVYSVEQINVIPFPNEEIILNDTFNNILSEIDRIDKEELLRKYTSRQVAEKLVRILAKTVKLYRDRMGRIVWFFAPWDYRRTEKAEEYNDELLEEAQRMLAIAVDKNYVVIEIREMDEGDSIFIAVYPDDVTKLKSFLKEYILA